MKKGYSTAIIRRIDEVMGQRFCYKCPAYRNVEGGREVRDTRGKPRWVCVDHLPEKMRRANQPR